MTIDCSGVAADAWGRWKRDRALLLPLAGLLLFLPQFAFYLLATPFPQLTAEQAQDTSALLTPDSPLVAWITHNAPGMLATVLVMVAPATACGPRARSSAGLSPAPARTSNPLKSAT